MTNSSTGHSKELLTEVLFVGGTSPDSIADWPGTAYGEEIADGMFIQRNVTVPMRDGKLLRVDLYRPEHTRTDLPVLVAWSPYGKHGQLDWRSWPGHDVPLDTLSSHTCFETPDPAYWTGHDYAVIIADARGSWGSEGSVTLLGPPEAEACYDLVEWAAEQDWSTGKVGMAGVSWYAAIQWAVAALRPPHLAAINPWEGFSDNYYEVGAHGGIPETAFTPMLLPQISNSFEGVEDVVTMAMTHPFNDDYWATKRPDLEAITVPAFVVASWSDHGLHTRGSLEGFRRISSTDKWLFVHGRKKWQQYYQPDNVDRQRAFFDRFLRGVHNEVDHWPPVTIEVRETHSQGTLRAEGEWPLARTTYTPLSLNVETNSMDIAPVAWDSSAVYESRTGSIHFDRTFDTDTEITGYNKLRLWVSTDESDDMDLFVALQKLDSTGTKVDFPFFSTFDDGNIALGWLRVSRRELTARSTPEQPNYAHEKDLPLARGEIVPVEIEIWPSSTLFRAGETLRLLIQGHDVNTYADRLFAQRHEMTKNSGMHTIYAGGKYDSHLLVAIAPTAEPMRGSGRPM